MRIIVDVIETNKSTSGMGLNIDVLINPRDPECMTSLGKRIHAAILEFADKVNANDDLNGEEVRDGE